MSRNSMMHVCVKEECEDKGGGCGKCSSEGWWYGIVCVVVVLSLLEICRKSMICVKKLRQI